MSRRTVDHICFAVTILSSYPINQLSKHNLTSIYQQNMSSAPNSTRARLPDVPWNLNNFELANALLTEVEKPENSPPFFGKAHKDDVSASEYVLFGLGSPVPCQNTSGESKIKICKWIALAIIPQLYHQDPNVAGNRVKSKIES